MGAAATDPTTSPGPRGDAPGPTPTTPPTSTTPGAPTTPTTPAAPTTSTTPSTTSTTPASTPTLPTGSTSTPANPLTTATRPTDHDHDDDDHDAGFPSTGSTGQTTPTGGGGQVGLLLISRYVKPNTADLVDYYNHFSLLATIENLFGLKRLGYAGDLQLPVFDAAIFNAHP